MFRFRSAAAATHQQVPVKGQSKEDVLEHPVPINNPHWMTRVYEALFSLVPQNLCSKTKHISSKNTGRLTVR